jgi:hypothetical protein
MRRKLVATDAPLGCLHDPLDSLAERVHGFLTFRRRIVSADEKGNVLVDDAEQFDPTTIRSIIGIYDVFTLIPSIEADLRRTLRERASRWIVDWNAPSFAHKDRAAHAPAIPGGWCRHTSPRMSK